MGDGRTDASLEVAQILQEYENLIKVAKEVSASVVISSVCPPKSWQWSHPVYHNLCKTEAATTGFY